jgi:hypothetical protein
MTPLTRNSCEAIIERLATFKAQCPSECSQDHEHTRYSSVLIGDVLEFMRDKGLLYKAFPIRKGMGTGAGMALICRTWEPFGFTKSLQTILSEARWETTIESSGNPGKIDGRAVERLSEPANSLFLLLDSLLPKK